MAKLFSYGKVDVEIFSIEIPEWGVWSLPVKDREQLKTIILQQLPEDQPLKLVDLLLKLKISQQKLLGALQSLASAHLLKVARLKSNPEAAEEVWLARNEVPEAKLAMVGPGAWSYNPQQLAVRQKYLATLHTTAAGEAEPERQHQEQQRLKEQLAWQEKVLAELFKDGQAMTREELEHALGGPILPKVKTPVLRLISGRYALADSPAAWQDAADYVTKKGPLSYDEFARKFRIHGGLLANIRAGKEITPFVVLPNGYITTSETDAGKAELAKRRIRARLKDKLAQVYRDHPFFTLGQIIEDSEQREEATQIIKADGAYRVNINGVGLWTSPYPHDPRFIAQELKRLTGQHLEAGQGAEVVPLTWLASHSMTVSEAADKLRLGEDDILNLCELDELSSFRLDGNRRLWRDEVREIKYRPDLHKTVKRATKLNTLEAADLLGTTPERVRRLVREGYLNAVGKIETEGGRMGILVRRGDVQAIKERFPGIEHEWSLAARQQRRESTPAQRKEKLPSGKKRPRRAVTAPPPVPGPVQLDAFQEQAVKAALAGKNVLVAAPTGTGKTVIAERLIEAVMARGKAAVYTSPLKALSNQKFVDFRNVFGHDMVGLVTGDISINPYAPLLIMTTEIFRNRCFSEPEGLDDVACVVFDEIHYLDDPDRGTAWEESIIFAPPHVKFLGLSATVPNIQEIADWMAEVRGEPVEVVVERNRAVPLAINWLTSEGAILDEDEAREYIEEAVKRRVEERRAERQAAREDEFTRRGRRWGKHGTHRSRKSINSH